MRQAFFSLCNVVWILMASHVSAGNYTRADYQTKLTEPVVWEGNLWTEGAKYAADFEADGWPETAHLLIRHIRSNIADGADLTYDGVSIEGMNYHFLYLVTMLGSARVVMGYTDGSYTPPAGYTKITSPLTIDDLMPAGFRSRHAISNGLLLALPDGSDCGAHDTGLNEGNDFDVPSSVSTWGAGGRFHFYGCEYKAVSYLLGGFGQLGMGEGKHGDPYLQTQALLHFSPKNSYHDTKPGTGHAANDTLMFGLFGRGRNLISFPGHQNQYHMPHNKNVVLVQNKMQSHYHSDLGGRLEVFSAMPGLKVARVDGSHIIHSDGPSAAGTVSMNRFRRTLLTNTVDIEKSYVVEVYEVDGGTEHTYRLSGSLVLEQSDPITDLSMAASATPYSDSHWDKCTNTRKGDYSGTKKFYVDFRFTDKPKLGTRTHVPAQGQSGTLYTHRLEETYNGNVVNGGTGRPSFSLHRSAASGTLKSIFVLVHEVKDGTNDTFISSVTHTSVGTDAVGVEVVLKNGREDTYLISLNGRQDMSVGSLSANALIAATSIDGSDSDLWMVDGSQANNGSRAILGTPHSSTGTINRINRLQTGDTANSIETDLSLTAGDALCGQTVLVEHYENGSLKFVNGHTIDYVETVGNGSRIHLRTDPGISVSGTATEELYFPWRSATSAKVRFLPSVTSVPYIAKITPDPESWQVIRGQATFAVPTDGTVAITTVPSGTPVNYHLDGGSTEGTAYDSLVLKGSADLVFNVSNPGGLAADAEIAERFTVMQHALAATTGNAGLSLRKYSGQNITFDPNENPPNSYDFGRWKQNPVIITGLTRDKLAYIATTANSNDSTTIDGNYRGAVIDGYINVPTTGIYTFYSRVDSDCQVVVGDEIVIRRAGMRNVAQWSGQIYLEKGIHAIQVNIFNRNLGGMEIAWSGPGIAYQAIPENRLFSTINPTTSPNYSVTYSVTGGGSITGSATQTVAAGNDASSVTASPATGYTFVTWSDGVTTSARQDTDINADLSVQAFFEETPVVVTYNTLGSGVIAGIATQTLAPGEETVDVTAVPDDGMTFVKWSDGQTQATRSDIAGAAGVTITALFSDTAPEMTVLGNGVPISDGDTVPDTADDTGFGPVTVSQSHAHTFTIENSGTSDLTLSGTPPVDVDNVAFTVTTDPASPVAASGSTTFVITFSPGISGDQTATVTIANDDADENPYTFDVTGEGISQPTYVVTYDGNNSDGGSVPVDLANYLETDTVTVETTGTMTRTGFRFEAWNTQADGSGMVYAPGDTFTMGTANLSLYAQWTALPTYTVTYDDNGSDGGTVPTDAASYLETASVTVMAVGTMTQTGYTFTQWNTLADGSGTAYAAGDTFTMGTTDVTLYAQWVDSTAVTHSLAFQTGSTVGATLSGPIFQVVVDGDDALAVTANAPTGYTFSKWTVGGADHSTGNPLIMTAVTQDMTLVAEFTQTSAPSGGGGGGGGGCSLMGQNSVTNLLPLLCVFLIAGYRCRRFRNV